MNSDFFKGIGDYLDFDEEKEEEKDEQQKSRWPGKRERG